MVYSNRTRRTAALLLGFIAIGSAVAGAAEQFQVGQRWVFEHKGPRPGSMEPDAIDGQRIRQVLSTALEQDKPTWVIEEGFTNDPNATSLLYVDHERQLTAFDVENDQGQAVTFVYDTPQPYQVPFLEPGQEKTYETTLRLSAPKFAMPTTSVIKRLPDETIVTPAGEFVNCQHYHTTTKSTMNIKIAKIPVTDERDQWYHPSVNGLVKEVYRKGPIKFLAWSCEGYTSTSVLASYDVVDAEAITRLAGPTDPNAPMGRSTVGKSKTPSTGNRAGWFVFILIAVATVLLLRRRVRPNTPAQSDPVENDPVESESPVS